MWRYSIICLLVLAGSVRALAQNVVFTAAASADKMGQQDQIQITYTIQNAQDLQTLTPVGLEKEFTVVSGPFQSQGSQTYYSNGKMTQTTSLSLTYVVQPKRTGNISIPGAIAKDAQGHSYQSNAMTIEVVQGSVNAGRRQQQADPFGDDDPFAAIRQMQQRRAQAYRQQQQQRAQQGGQQQPDAKQADVNIDKDIFIRVAVDKSKVHVGEQITTSYKLYARIPMNVSISKLPSLNGFWTQDFDIPKNNIKPTEEIIDGKKYQVFLLKKSALFPQQTGNLELDAAEAEGVARIVQQVRQRNPFSGFFDDDPFASLMMGDPMFNDDFFNTMAYKDVKVHLKSTPVKISVTPLPEDGKPTDFGGAVGNSFTMNGKLDKTDITTDDVLTYKLNISGSGNLKLFEAPAMSLPNGLSVFDPVITDTITGRTTTISGTKTITYTITPKTAGDYTIPAMSFSYFNPQTGKYTTLNTEPVRVHVKQGKLIKGNDTRSIATLTDIHPIYKKEPGDLAYNSKPVLYSVGYWSLYAVPLFAFIGIAFWKRREDELSKDSVLLRNRRANKVALKRLAVANKLLQQNSRKPFYEEISKAIWLYLSDKLNIPLSELSRERAEEALYARKISPEMEKQINQVVNECETALYAPSGGLQQMNYTYQQAVDIISKLEESFNA
jgi:hypothetical protein